MVNKSKSNWSKIIIGVVCVFVLGVVGYFGLNMQKDNKPQVVFNDDVLQLGMSQDPNDLLKDWDAESIECCKYVDVNGVETAVVTKPGEYTVYFTAINKGYETEFKKKVNIIDDVPPVFENVASEVNVEYENDYDPSLGVKAVDNVDGEIDFDVVNLDSSSPQKIIVEFTAKDAAGNQAKATTTINVNAPACPTSATFNWEKGICE